MSRKMSLSENVLLLNADTFQKSLVYKPVLTNNLSVSLKMDFIFLRIFFFEALLATLPALSKRPVSLRTRFFSSSPFQNFDFLRLPAFIFFKHNLLNFMWEIKATLEISFAVPGRFGDDVWRVVFQTTKTQSNSLRQTKDEFTLSLKWQKRIRIILNLYYFQNPIPI